MVKKGNKTPQKIFILVLMIGLLLRLFRYFYKKNDIIDEAKHNLKKFFKSEKKEIKEFAMGKETFNHYCENSFSLFRDYFIPHAGNNHKPKILHARSLILIVVLAAVIKVALTGYLFFIYPNQAWMEQQMTSEIITLINQDRAKENLAPLTRDNILSASALAKADDMSIRNYFAHYSPDGKKPWDWIDRGDYAYLLVGENLAINFTSAASVHEALMNSPLHKKNIMNGRYKDIGLAVISGEINGAKTNILVELFAVRQTPELKLASVPSAANVTAGATEPALLSGAAKPAVLGTEKPNTPVKPEPTKLAAVKPAVVKPVAGKPAETKPAENLPVKTLADNNTVRDEAAPKDAQNDLRVITFGEGTKVNDTSFMLGAADQTARPDAEMEKNLESTISYYIPQNGQPSGLAARLIVYSQEIYLGALIFMTLALTVNILVRISIQHKPVIIQTMFVIVFLIGLLTVRLHILEQIAGSVAIL